MILAVTFAAVKNSVNITLNQNLSKMRPINSKVLIGLLALAFAYTSCNPINKFAKNLKKAQYKANPEILAVNGDSVDIAFKVVLPKRTIPSKGVAKFEPMLVFGSDEIVLDPLIIKGSKADEPNAQYTSTDGSITAEYYKRVEYRPEYKRCTLYLQPNLKIKSYEEVLDKCIEIIKDSIGLGTVTTALSLKSNEEVSYPEAKCLGPKMERTANIYYVVDQTDFKPKLVQKLAKTSNPDELKSLVSYLKVKTEYNLVGITLRSMASPDGSFKRNALLARNRDVTVYNFMKNELKRLGFQEVNDSMFTARNQVTEQLEDLKVAIQSSNLKSKDYFLNILNSDEDPDVKERKMRDEYADGNNNIDHKRLRAQNPKLYPHWTDYQYILKYIMPRLRRSEITIIGEKGCKSASDVARFASSGMFDSLNIDEILVYAHDNSDLGQKEKAYRHLTNKYNSDWRGHNNLGAVQIMQKNYADAKVNLDKALSLNKDAGEIYNNLGIFYRNQKNYEKAEENYNKAKSAGIKPASYNQGILNIARGKYGDAISNFKASGNTCNYNTGLAYTLNGEYSSGQKAVDCMETKDKDAQAWYLKAIMAARAKDVTNMGTYLSKAIQMDSKYKQVAMEDLEFMSFWKSNDFRAAVK